MFLKITTPSDEAATAVVETAIECGGDPTDIREHRLPEATGAVFSVYLKGSQQRLDECRKAIVKQKYYRPGLFSFRSSPTISTLLTESEK